MDSVIRLQWAPAPERDLSTITVSSHAEVYATSATICNIRDDSYLYGRAAQNKELRIQQKFGLIWQAAKNYCLVIAA